MISDTLGNIISSYTYNSFGELRSYTVKVDTNEIFKTIYTRDDLGRITRIDETVEDSTTVKEYTYDTAGRLTEVKINNIVSSEYVYDSNGNRLAYISGTDTTRATYDEQDRLLTYGTEEYLHDKNGYLITQISGIDSTKFVYDDFGNLINVLLPNGDSIDYLIDANNRRIGKLINRRIMSKYIFEDQLNPVAELDSNDNIISRFIYGAKSNIPDYIVKGDSTYKVVSDHLGSVRLVINTTNGEIAEHIDYDEYGRVLTHDGSFEQPFGYAGGLTDTQTGLIRFGARDYSAATGRWRAKDPSFFNGQDFNLFGYCHTDPVNLVDNNGAGSGRAQLMMIGAAISFSQGISNGETGWELAASIGIGAVAGFFGGIATREKATILAGFVVGAVSNAISQLRSGTDIQDIKVGSMISSGVVGALGAGFSGTFPESNFRERATFAVITAIADYISTTQFMNYYMSRGE